MGLPRQKDAEPPPAFSMTLSRGLTNAAFVEDLEADERMARVRGDREESSRKEERRTNMRLARCLASWFEFILQRARDEVVGRASPPTLLPSGWLATRRPTPYPPTLNAPMLPYPTPRVS